MTTIWDVCKTLNIWLDRITPSTHPNVHLFRLVQFGLEIRIRFQGLHDLLQVPAVVQIVLGQMLRRR